MSLFCLNIYYICYNVNGDSMRLRKVHGAKDLIAKHREYIIDNLDNEFIDLARSVYYTNDERFRLKNKIKKSKHLHTKTYHSPLLAGATLGDKAFRFKPKRTPLLVLPSASQLCT